MFTTAFPEIGKLIDFNLHLIYKVNVFRSLSYLTHPTVVSQLRLSAVQYWLDLNFVLKLQEKSVLCISSCDSSFFIYLSLYYC